jgi:hypothetical protein
MSPPAHPGALALCVALCACAGADDVVCSSGQMAGTSEGEDMAPGQTCIACHAFTNAGGDGMEAPSFAFAGTVYRTAHEPDGCVGGPVGAGSDRAQVEVTSATGQRFVAEVSAGGNFMFEAAAIAFPIKARVRFQGRTAEMVQAQPSGDCNLCHTVAGGSGAPGRILLP